jgi:hypothetical protein
LAIKLTDGDYRTPSLASFASCKISDQVTVLVTGP